MSIIGAAIVATGALAGGILGSRAARKGRRALEEQKRMNQAWYDRRYNEDATQRADAQLLLNRTEEHLRNRGKAAAGAAAVMGATESSVAAEKAANSKVLADTAAQIAANADARKDAIESQYMQTDQALAQQQMALKQQQASAIGGAVQGVTNAVASMDFGGEDVENLKTLKTQEDDLHIRRVDQ